MQELRSFVAALGQQSIWPQVLFFFFNPKVEFAVFSLLFTLLISVFNVWSCVLV